MLHVAAATKLFSVQNLHSYACIYHVLTIISSLLLPLLQISQLIEYKPNRIQALNDEILSIRQKQLSYIRCDWLR
jgi:hypothetical protein